MIHRLLPDHLTHLPAPSADAAAHSERLAAHIRKSIAHAGGWIDFAQFMDLALHAPGLGYYSAGLHKFGGAGDFVTAPELGSLFATSLARQAAQLLQNGALSEIIEYGAGSGRLARDLLRALAELDCLPQRYCILEISADLRARQKMLLDRESPQIASRVVWLDAMPSAIDALVIANEVLDAMPVHVVRARNDGVDEVGVVADSDGFAWQTRTAAGALLEAAQQLPIVPGCTTEIGLAAAAFTRTLAASLKRGAAIFIDYGFPAREYYHPQRSGGTLMCHYRHHAHADPLCLVGLQDITAHIDFSAIAGAAVAAARHLLHPPVVEPDAGGALVLCVDLGEVGPGAHTGREHPLEHVLIDHAPSLPTPQPTDPWRWGVRRRHPSATAARVSRGCWCGGRRRSGR